MDRTKKTYGIFDKAINRKLVEQIELAGNSVFRVPQVQTKDLVFTNEDTNILENLNEFDWVVFTDVFAVEYFVNKLESEGIDLFELDNLRVCAYGESVADRLRFVQIHSDVIANKVVDSKVFQQISDYLFDTGDFIELNVLVIKEERRDFELTKIFEKSKSNVTRLSVYKSEKIESFSKIKALTMGGVFDEFIFSSAEDIFEFSNLFYPVKLPLVLNGINVFAKDEVTFQTLIEFELQPNYFK